VRHRCRPPCASARDLVPCLPSLTINDGRVAPRVRGSDDTWIPASASICQQTLQETPHAQPRIRRHCQHPHACPRRAGRQRQDQPGRGPAVPGRRDRRARQSGARLHGERLRPGRAPHAALVDRRGAASGGGRQGSANHDPGAPDRHPGGAGLPRPVPARARSGGNRRGGDQRDERHRADGGAHDGVRRGAPSGPHDHRQQDRCPRGRPGRAAGADPGHVRPGMPGLEPAFKRRRRGGRLLLQPRGRG
jgi:hypothetical protein